MNIKEGKDTAVFYLNEIEKINNIKSNNKRFKEMIALSNNWANEEKRVNITDSMNQYISERFAYCLGMYESLTFKGRIKNFVKNFNVFGR